MRRQPKPCHQPGRFLFEVMVNKIFIQLCVISIAHPGFSKASQFSGTSGLFGPKVASFNIEHIYTRFLET